MADPRHLLFTDRALAGRGLPGALLALVMLLTGACGGPTPVAPVTDRAKSLRQPESEYRTVVHGDTLYSIAWESGRDYKGLAALNNIPPPYTIRPGQKIRLYPPPAAAVDEKPPEKPSAKKPEKVEKPATAPAQAESKKPPAAPTALASPKAGAREFGSWGWPAQGKILSQYSENGTSKGLDIGVARGQPVLAAANGRVVYQGSGLRGYGQLIIVKHSEEFLSAYEHNDKIFVKEGDVVKRGQRIATVGSTGTDRVKLHFEIRRNGVPVDPLKYLPKK